MMRTVSDSSSRSYSQPPDALPSSAGGVPRHVRFGLRHVAIKTAEASSAALASEGRLTEGNSYEH